MVIHFQKNNVLAKNSILTILEVLRLLSLNYFIKDKGVIKSGHG